MSKIFDSIYPGSPEQMLEDCMTIPLPVHDMPGWFVCEEGFAITPEGKITEGSRHGVKGYRMIGKRSNRKYLHRAIAEAFIPNPDNLPYVRHLDDDPQNNSVSNLAWGTQKDNMGDCIRNGNFGYFTNEDREKAMQKRRTPVIAISFDGTESYYISQNEAARQLKLHQSDVANVLSGKQKSAHGYRFRRAEND